MGNDNIEEISTLMAGAFEKGQEVISLQVFPLRMTDENMKSHPQSTIKDFWMNLREGYDYFENRKIPPVVRVQGGKYCFK